MSPRQLHCNRGTAFSTRSVPIYYKQGQLAVAGRVRGVSERVRKLLGFRRCKLLLLEACSIVWGQYGDSEEGNFRRWEPLPSNGSEDVTVDTGVSV
jgi:hypothetical protein